MNDTGYPKPPAQAQPYVDALGLEDAMKFFHAFAGTEVYIAQRPTERSEIVKVVGYAKARSLASIADRLQARVPTVKEWRAKVYASQNLSIPKIARKIGVTDVTIRKYLSGTANKKPDTGQMSLF